MQAKIEEFTIKANRIIPYSRQLKPLLRVNLKNEIYIKNSYSSDTILLNSQRDLFLERNKDKFDYHYDILT